MKVYYFKDQRIEEALRDERGDVVIDGEGKSKTVDYKSIQLKVPISENKIDFDAYSRYAPMVLLTEFDFLQLQEGKITTLSDLAEKQDTIISFSMKLGETMKDWAREGCTDDCPFKTSKEED